jgi:hypothetical protein
LGIGQPRKTFNDMSESLWVDKLEEELVKSGLPNVIKKLTRELVDESRQRAHLFDLDNVCRHVRKMSQTLE